MSEGMRTKTMEEILREKIDALKEQIERLGRELNEKKQSNISLMNEKVALEARYDEMCTKFEECGHAMQDFENEITKHRLDKEHLRGKVAAYENIFANHNLSLYAKNCGIL